jgi:hypothetical protein
MKFFRCSKCGCVENTALCYFWSSRINGTPTLCSACDPKISKWHNHFPREKPEGWMNDTTGLIFHRSEVEQWLGLSLSHEHETIRH